ncbi:MAG: sodium:solute symporter [Candidatus Marinimicrobia bacterium]|nr:sodium:solute symporter [Candidatus Neomarinimicrobiota bacterium]
MTPINSGFQTFDLIVICLYLLIVALIGSFSGGKQRSVKDYFLGGSNVPWWAVSFAIVAAETSTLTFISIPGLAYIANLNFLQVTIGYLIGRIVVSYLFLPAYKKGELTTAYALLENRFGQTTRRYASVVFLFTRVAADGVRLFATSIPLALIFRSFPFFDGFTTVQIYAVSIVIITIVTLIYTYTGGVKGIIWVDVLQMGIYLGGALIALIILFQKVPGGLSAVSQFSGDVNKFSLINLNFSGFFSEPYTLFGSLIGGCLLSMASHGTDQLIVQRLLTTKSLKDSQKALITSGVVVIIQFTLFLLVGLMLFAFFKGNPIGSDAMPFTKADEIFPYFIIYYLPTGVRGLIIAGLFAAAMSTLAGSMSSLSSSTMMDLYQPIFGSKSTDEKDLRISRLLTIFWGIILTIVAFLFIRVLQSVVEIALGISSITYGGLLGTFLLGVLFRKTNQKSALWGFSAGILCMVLLIIIPFLFGVKPIVHWTWYVLIGASMTIIVGNIVTYVQNRK